jgi:hypothetical protein
MNDRHEPEEWRVLCELASREQDSSKLIGLISELNRALDESLNLKVCRVCATPATSHSIAPIDLVRLERVRCPACGKDFVPVAKAR